MRLPAIPRAARHRLLPPYMDLRYRPIAADGRAVTAVGRNASRLVGNDTATNLLEAVVLKAVSCGVLPLGLASKG